MDIEKLINHDPAYKILTTSSLTTGKVKNNLLIELKLLNIRKVPGDFKLLEQKKFQILM